METGTAQPVLLPPRSRTSPELHYKPLPREAKSTVLDLPIKTPSTEGCDVTRSNFFSSQMQKLQPKEAGSKADHPQRPEKVPGAVPSVLLLCCSVLCLFLVYFVGEPTRHRSAK